MWYLKKRQFCQALTIYIFIVPFLLNFLQDFLHIPSLIKYTVDVAWILPVLYIFLSGTPVVIKRTLPILVFIAVYLLYVTVVYILQYQSIFYFLWGLRNNLRYFIAFMLFVYFFDKDDIRSCLKFIDILFVVHAVVTFFQFFVLGYKWDYLGGIFGVQLGCNGNSMIFLIIVSVKSLLTYIHGSEGLGSCLLKCSVALIIAAMSELKFFFLVFLVILLIAALITRFSAKKILLIIGVALIVFLASEIFTHIWGDAEALSIDRIVELITTSTTYSSKQDLGRLTAIPQISKSYLTSIPLKLFGMGLGNCETSSFAICNTPFYQAHANLNYDWLSSAFSFIETGFVGLALLLSFFIIVFICARTLKRKGECQELYADISMTMTIVCVIMIFYNSSLRTDIGYIAYFMLAIPFVSSKSESLFQLFSGQSN